MGKQPSMMMGGDEKVLFRGIFFVPGGRSETIRASVCALRVQTFEYLSIEYTLP